MSVHEANYLYSWVIHAFPHERPCASLTLFTLEYKMYCRDGNIYSQHEFLLTLFTHEYKMYCRDGKHIFSTLTTLDFIHSWVHYLLLGLSGFRLSFRCKCRVKLRSQKSTGIEKPVHPYMGMRAFRYQCFFDVWI